MQGAIEAAFTKIGPDAPTLSAAGRTDAGVHATGQVAHADLTRDWDPFKLCGALNYHLRPHPVSILAAAKVADDWHARFSAVERRYLFRLLSRRSPATHDRGLVWQVPHPLNVEAMAEGAQHLLGLHDFTTFRATMCQAKSPIKSIDEISVIGLPVPGGVEIQVRLRARSFLHNQVRSIVGSLERVGAGSWAPDDIKVALEAKNRAACGPVCPPDGLYLTKAVYPDDPFKTF